jgi:ACS family hexuronate transporter-like MFS transporter
MGKVIENLATAFGFIAVGSGLGGMLSTGAVGWLVTHFSYQPVFLILAALHPLALVAARHVPSRHARHM